jgi:hypothetical protein
MDVKYWPVPRGGHERITQSGRPVSGPGCFPSSQASNIKSLNSLYEGSSAADEITSVSFQNAL